MKKNKVEVKDLKAKKRVKGGAKPLATSPVATRLERESISTLEKGRVAAANSNKETGPDSPTVPPAALAGLSGFIIV